MSSFKKMNTFFLQLILIAIHRWVFYISIKILEKGWDGVGYLTVVYGQLLQWPYGRLHIWCTKSWAVIL